MSASCVSQQACRVGKSPGNFLQSLFELGRGSVYIWITCKCLGLSNNSVIYWVCHRCLFWMGLPNLLGLVGLRGLVVLVELRGRGRPQKSLTSKHLPTGFETRAHSKLEMVHSPDCVSKYKIKDNWVKMAKKYYWYCLIVWMWAVHIFTYDPITWVKNLVKDRYHRPIKIANGTKFRHQ